MLAHLCADVVLEAEVEDPEGGGKGGAGGTGVVVLDWVGAGGDWDLCWAIIAYNQRFLAAR